MFKKILVPALVAACALGSVAEETLYLIKGDHVVAKYNVEDVDYAAFALPEGVQDLEPSRPAISEAHYMGAVGTYYGTHDEIADFQIHLSTRAITSETIPVQFLYLQFMAPAADYKDLHFNEGAYTLGNADDRKPFTFYAGVRQTTVEGEAAGGSLLVDRPDPETTEVTLVTGGQFSIAKTDNGYAFAGMLKLEDGTVLEFDYEGACVIDNNSDEKDPAEELDLPASKLTGDVNLEIDSKEAYATEWKGFFNDLPHLDYIYMLLYTDDTYANSIQLGLLVDRAKHPDCVLPAGKYPVVSRTDGSLNTVELAAMPAFQVIGDLNIAQYGCWCGQDYYDSPLVAGEVEVLEDSADLNNVSLRIMLKDTSNPAHTVTATYSGPLAELL